jgi:hypothetical protein
VDISAARGFRLIEFGVIASPNDAHESGLEVVIAVAKRTRAAPAQAPRSGDDVAKMEGTEARFGMGLFTLAA